MARCYSKIALIGIVCTTLLLGCKDGWIPVAIIYIVLFGDDSEEIIPVYYENCPYPITTQSHAVEVARHITNGIGSRIHGSFVDPAIANGSYSEETIECYPGTITFSGIISRSTLDCGDNCLLEVYNSNLILTLDECKTTFINPDPYPILVTGTFRLNENITIERQQGLIPETSGGYMISDNGTEITVRHQYYHCAVANKSINDTIYSIEITDSVINTGNPIYATYVSPEHVTLTSSEGEIAY